MEEIYYVYVTTCLKNGKQYVGDHKTYFIDTDPYLGSGKELIKDIKKYGKHNFNREILETFTTREEAFFAQEKYIRKFNCTYPNGYNLSLWGGILVSHNISEETKKRIGDGNRGKKRPHSEKHKKRIGKANKGKTRSPETREKMRKPHKKFSEETKQKMRNSKLGKPSNNRKKSNSF